MKPQGIQVSTLTDTTLVLTRMFRAPRRLVWESMFTPDKMRRWMLAPPAWTLTTCQCDARTDGTLSLAWKSDQADPAMTLKGVFTEVVLHEWAIHTETMALGSGEIIGSLLEKHEFAENDGVTTMCITQTYNTKENRDGALGSGMDDCLEPGYRQLDALLAGPA
jgi:uncharacterized protein YndB with AHSA1/START domain